ncbi:hypothetical protein GOODEAATRI_016183 [Goodea atripinnis]|uniref:Uncharacterized protein n=1 Tax=Goodea atripinnis TaxID=208336 RepID=A0ABV0MJC0_9TELE
MTKRILIRGQSRETKIQGQEEAQPMERYLSATNVPPQGYRLPATGLPPGKLSPILCRTTCQGPSGRGLSPDETKTLAAQLLSPQRCRYSGIETNNASDAREKRRRTGRTASAAR